MATHDYDIANQSGAAFRTDLNNALAAIQSNNSNSSSPATTVAYQWWADTTSGTLKIRNAANNAWVELLQLDGTLTLEDGSASTPALAFRDDLNTGIFSSAADTFNVATAGTERMELGATTIFNESGADVDFRIEGDTEANLFYVDAGNNKIGIGTATPSNLLHLKSGAPAIQFEDTDANGSAVSIIEDNNGFLKLRCDSGNAGTGSGIGFEVDGSERMRLDNSGRLGIGQSSPEGLLHIEASSSGASYSADGADTLILERNGGCVIDFRTPAANDAGLIFSDNSARAQGSILYNHNGNSLAFGTDGGERVRFDSNGNMGLGTTSPLNINNSKGITIKGAASSFSGFLNFRDSSNNEDGRVHCDNGSMFIEADPDNSTSSSRISMKVDTTEIIRIQNTGDVGVSFFATGSKFSVASDGQDCVFFRKNSSANQRTLALQNFRATSSTTGEQIGFFDEDGNKRGSIQNNTSTTSYSTSSDYRLKENEVLISDGITRIKTLKPYRFNWKNRPSETVDGFFAHEVTDAVPEAIYGEKDKIVSQADIDSGDFPDNNVGDPIYQEMDHSKLVPLLVAAVKELITKVETLEAA